MKKRYVIPITVVSFLAWNLNAWAIFSTLLDGASTAVEIGGKFTDNPLLERAKTIIDTAQSARQLFPNGQGTFSGQTVFDTAGKALNISAELLGNPEFLDQAVQGLDIAEGVYGIVEDIRGNPSVSSVANAGIELLGDLGLVDPVTLQQIAAEQGPPSTPEEALQRQNEAEHQRSKRLQDRATSLQSEAGQKELGADLADSAQSAAVSEASTQAATQSALASGGESTVVKVTTELTGKLNSAAQKSKSSQQVLKTLSGQNTLLSTGQASLSRQLAQISNGQAVVSSQLGMLNTSVHAGNKLVLEQLKLSAMAAEENVATTEALNKLVESQREEKKSETEAATKSSSILYFPFLAQ